MKLIRFAFSDGILRLARNEIFARYRRIFTADDLQLYFPEKAGIAYNIIMSWLILHNNMTESELIHYYTY